MNSRGHNDEHRDHGHDHRLHAPARRGDLPRRADLPAGPVARGSHDPPHGARVARGGGHHPPAATAHDALRGAAHAGAGAGGDAMSSRARLVLHIDAAFLLLIGLTFLVMAAAVFLLFGWPVLLFGTLMLQPLWAWLIPRFGGAIMAVDAWAQRRLGLIP